MTTIKGITSVPANTTFAQLVDIFDKVTRGVGLTVQEKGFLTQCSQAAPSAASRVWSYVRTPADEGSVQNISSLADRILNREVPVSKVFSEAEIRFKSCEHPSIRETASFAKLITSCLSREDIFTSLLSRFRTQYKKDPTREQLIRLVAQCNEAASPQVENAGQLVAQISYQNSRFETQGLLDVRYNHQGHLEIREGSVGPLLTCHEQMLTQAQINDMQDLYFSLSKETPLNNLGEMLDFIRFFEEQKKVNPELTLKQALAVYTPDLPRIFDKYQSGNCILLASKFCNALAKRGIQAQMMPMTALNPWSAIPIPGKEVEIRWDAYSKEVQGVDHTDAVCFFKHEDGSHRILRFRCSFEKDLEDEIITYTANQPNAALKKMIFELPIQETPDRVIDEGTIGKSTLLGRYKALIKKNDMILGVDFLRGNLYFKPNPGPEAFRGLPLNERGMVSIEITDLANPETKGIYTIDGVKKEISHGQALQMILERAGQEVRLPVGTEENLILLAQNVPALFDDFLLQPLPVIRQTHKDLVAIDKKLKALDGKMSPDDLSSLRERHELEAIVPITRNEANAAEKVASFRAEIEKLDRN